MSKKTKIAIIIVSALVLLFAVNYTPKLAGADPLFTLNDVYSMVTGLEQRTNELARELEEKEQDISELQDALQERTNDLLALQDALEQRTNDLLAMQEDLESTQSELAEAQAEMAAAQEAFKGQPFWETRNMTYEERYLYDRCGGHPGTIPNTPPPCGPDEE